MAFSVAAETDSELINTKTRDALQSRNLSGIQLGKPKCPGKCKLDVHKIEIEA